MQAVEAGVIKRVCAEVYGREFCDRTWQRWRKACGVALTKQIYSPIEWGKLIAFSKLKRENPFGSVSTAELYAEIRNLQASRSTSDQIRRVSRQVLPSQCFGLELISLIAQTTGRRPSIPTLYRWGKEIGIAFGKRRSYNTQEINKWIKQARKTSNVWNAA